MKQTLFIVFLSVLIFSCGSKQEKTSSPESRAFSVERENFFNSLKNPAEAATQLIPGLAGFDSTLLNDPAHFYRYTANDVKAAANLGIYISDLNYCVMFEKSASTKKYFEAVHELSKTMRIEKGILEFLMNRYQTNMEQNDSVKSVVNRLFEQSTVSLQGTDRERLAGIAMAGYQIENLHIALSTLESFPETLTDEQLQTQNLLRQYIFEQRGKFEVVYNFVRANSDPLDPNRNPNYPFFDNALRELIVAYRNVTPNDPKNKELLEKVNVIRNKVISIE
jgi:hypothetical protein